MAERWKISARCDYGKREYVAVTVDVGADNGGPGLQEALGWGYDALGAVGGTGISEPGDKVTLAIELVERKR